VQARSGPGAGCARLPHRKRVMPVSLPVFVARDTPDPRGRDSVELNIPPRRPVDWRVRCIQRAARSSFGPSGVIMQFHLPLPAAFLASCLILCGLGVSVGQVQADEIKLQVQLIWGTNGEKPKGRGLVEIDAKLRQGLAEIFRWKNYYQVVQKPLTAPERGSRKLKLSDKCEVVVQSPGGSKIQIQLIGEGNLVSTVTRSAVPGEPIVLGGPDKNDTAWFVVLTPTK
jgi:hypothetical protein